MNTVFIPCTKHYYFQVYKQNPELFPGRKMDFSVAYLKVSSKTITTLLNVNFYINGPTVQKKHRINHCKGRELFWLSVMCSALCQLNYTMLTNNYIYK